MVEGGKKLQSKDLRLKILEYIAFLASSARNSVEEPHLYGSFRLVDAISRLIDILKETSTLKEDKFLDELKEYIDNKKYTVVTNVQEYLAFLDNVVLKVLRELKGII